MSYLQMMNKLHTLVANQKRGSGTEKTFSLSASLGLDTSRISRMRSCNLLVEREKRNLLKVKQYDQLEG